jgi:uncharacterized metal-binding protein YceD (DUF177 family)
MSDLPIVSRPFEVALATPTGVHRHIVATPTECTALAEASGILTLGSLSADIVVKLESSGAIRVEGRVHAEIVQACVVTLDPVPQTVDEAFELRFVQPGSRGAPEPPRAGAEIMIDPERPDPPELLEGPTIDIGALAEEHFVLGIDPYPRAPGASLAEIGAEPAEEPPANPFAVLKALKRDRDPSA